MQEIILIIAGARDLVILIIAGARDLVILIIAGARDLVILIIAGARDLVIHAFVNGYQKKCLDFDMHILFNLFIVTSH